ARAGDGAGHPGLDAGGLPRGDEGVQGEAQAGLQGQVTLGGVSPLTRDSHEGRHLERERHPGAPRAGARPDRARATRRPLPPGAEGDARAGPRQHLQSSRVLVLLARRPRLLGRRAARVEGARRRGAAHHPSRVDHETRIAEVELGDVVLASVYVPNGGKDFAAKMAFLEALRGYAGRVHERGRQLVLCGDVNIAREERDVHPKERKPNAIGQRPDERAAFERLLACGLVDVGRALDPDNDALFTWWAPWRNLRQRNIGWRLDYVLASDAVARSASSCVSHREFGTSDHAPVVTTFDAAW